jgi:hypothetical protein
MFLKEKLNLPYTWSLSWVHSYVCIMFHRFSFSFKKHVSIMFSKVFSKHMVHNILNSINCKIYSYNWQRARACYQMIWLKNIINIQCMYYQPFIRIKQKKKVIHDVMFLRTTLNLPYIWSLSISMFVSCFYKFFPKT